MFAPGVLDKGTTLLGSGSSVRLLAADFSQKTAHVIAVSGCIDAAAGPPLCSAPFTRELRVANAPLLAVIAGGSRSVGAQQSFVLDASASGYADDPHADLAASWSCTPADAESDCGAVEPLPVRQPVRQVAKVLLLWKYMRSARTSARASTSLLCMRRTMFAFVWGTCCLFINAASCSAQDLLVVSLALPTGRYSFGLAVSSVATGDSAFASVMVEVDAGGALPIVSVDLPPGER